MYSELYRYLITHNQLILPGIGVLSLNRKSAESDFVHRQILPSSYSVSLEETNEQPTTNFYKWLSSAFSISDKDAIIRFNDFVFGLKKQLNEGAIINWDKIGILKNGLSGTINFKAEEYATDETPVTAEKVIRENTEHKILVGEEEKSSLEMGQILNPSITKKSYWWIAPLILIVLSLVFIVWYWSNNGFVTNTVGNNAPL
ncbi:MAG: hypothetical protein JST23_11270 [Bacteroidetes bacterium]|nr:hypothetical protein [Bacteroidota bacterium]